MTEKIYYPTNDYIFRRIFGTSGNEKITISLLNSILSEHVTSIDLANNFQITPKNIHDKMGMLDVKATVNNNIKCDIEMQISGDNNNTARFLKYWANLYDSLSKGEDYQNLTKTIVILFIDYEDNLIDNIPKLNTSWHIREDTYSQYVLTDFFEFRIITLRKLKDLANNQALDSSNKNSLISWLKFLKNPEKLEVNDMEIEGIKDAKNEFEKIQMSDEERELARLREKYFLEMHDAEKSGIRKVARNMKNKNFEISIIQEMTGLSKEEIEKL